MDWYHTIDLPGLGPTPGYFDTRGAPVPLPERLDGLRCLDVGTYDGYWAFEMERRGAASVTALDLEDPEQLDWPASLRPDHDKSMDATKAKRWAAEYDGCTASARRLAEALDKLESGPLPKLIQEFVAAV